MKKTRYFLLFLLLAAAFLWWYSTFTLTTATVTIESGKIDSAVTIVHLTDLHGSSFGKDNALLIRRVQEAQPDLVVVTGDMYTAGDEKGRATALSLLQQLASDYEVYFINGEHDASDTFCEDLSVAGVHVFNYETATIPIRDNEIVLYGINNVYYTPTFDLANEFTLDPSKYNILLAHASNFDKFAQFGIDLSICGDTHGGQVRLPYFGAVINRGQWFPEMQLVPGDARYTKGLYTQGDSQLFISGGLGNYPLPIRFLNRPEIAVIQLKNPAIP